VSDTSESVETFGAVHFDAGAPQSREERVAHEEPLEIQVNGAAVAVLMRTPGHDEELVTGFLLTERVVAGVADLESVRHCSTAPTPEAEDNVVQVRLAAHVPFDLERLRRHTFASSSCGVCGKATIENACALASPVHDDGDVRVAPAVLARMVPALRAAQSAFDETGGLHGAGAFTSHGALVLAREDVGRHNAVDKVIGACARQGLARPEVLLVSGRVSFEIVQKAAAARVPVVAGVSAPTSLAVRMARALNITLVGFLRGTSMNVYAGEQRVHGAESP
jgi:FdhD protein